MNHNLSTLQVVAILRLRDGKYLFSVKISKICIVPDFFFFFFFWAEENSNGLDYGVLFQ